MSSKETEDNKAAVAFAATLYTVEDLLLDADDCDHWRRDTRLSDESAAHLAAVATIRRETAARLANIAFSSFKAEGDLSPETV